MTSKGKVIHLDDETHTALKDYCEEHGISMAAFIKDLIDSKLVNVVPLAREERVGAEPVAKKTLPQGVSSSVDVDGVMSGPPFWEDRD